MNYDFFKLINVLNILNINNFIKNKDINELMNNNINNQKLLSYYLNHNLTILNNKHDNFFPIINIFIELYKKDLINSNINYYLHDNFLFILNNKKIDKDILNKKNLIIIGISLGTLNPFIKKFDYTLYPIGILNDTNLNLLNDFKKNINQFYNCISIGYHTNSNKDYIGYHTNTPLYNYYYNDIDYFLDNEIILHSIYKECKNILKYNVNNLYLLNIIKIKNILKYSKYNNKDYITVNNIIQHYNNFYKLEKYYNDISLINNNYILLKKDSLLLKKLLLIEKININNINNFQIIDHDINFNNIKLNLDINPIKIINEDIENKIKIDPIINNEEKIDNKKDIFEEDINLLFDPNDNDLINNEYF